MAFDWEHVEKIRAEQNANRMRYDSNAVPTNEVISRINQSEGARVVNSPHLDHYEALIMKMRTQLIDYIVAHGLVDGWVLNGVLMPVENGKIVLTNQTIKDITDKFGYFTEEITEEYLSNYLPEHNYVSDANYVHTDNNYDDAAVAKLAGIEDGAEVNKIIDLVFNGSTVLDGDTRIATITITPEDIKAWYESNPDTNVFSDADKGKLDGIEESAQVNKIEDVTLDGESILDNADKTAKITKELVKTSYESNPDTNAFTDTDKAKLDGIEEGAEVNEIVDVTLDGETIVDKNKIAKLTALQIKNAYESNPDTNAYTDAAKSLIESVLPQIQKDVANHEQRIDTLETNEEKQNTRFAEIEAKDHLQDDEIEALKEKDASQDEEIQKLKDADAGLTQEIANAKDSISELGDETNTIAGRVTTLEMSQVKQDSEIGTFKERLTKTDMSVSGLQLIVDNHTESIREFEAKDSEQDEKITDLEIAVAEAGKVDDVQVDGVSVLDVETKTANITGLVPYTGATKDINLGSYFLRAGQADNASSSMNRYGFGVRLSGTVYESARRTDITAVGTTLWDVDNTDSRGNTWYGNHFIASDDFAIYNTEGSSISTLTVADPTKDTHAATKKYVDDAVASASSGAQIYSSCVEIATSSFDVDEELLYKVTYTRTGQSGAAGQLEMKTIYGIVPVSSSTPDSIEISARPIIYTGDEYVQYILVKVKNVSGNTRRADVYINITSSENFETTVSRIVQ